MERSENITRERDPRGWHLVAVVCGRCGHFSWRDVLFRPGRAAAQIEAIERRLVCAKCGGRQGNRLEPAEGALAPPRRQT